MSGVKFNVDQKQAASLFALLLVGFVLMSCNTKKNPIEMPEELSQFALSKTLNEISGLAWVSDSVLACVQDEKAVVYYISTETGEIIDSFDFGQNGDFEGIAVKGNKTFILRSDGQILISKKGKKAKGYKFKKGGGIDFEGLCLDEDNKRLLVACKQQKQKKKDGDVFIYAFSLKKKEYQKKPVFVLSKKKLGKEFRPSGIAMQPDNTIYLLSSQSKSIAIISSKGDILQLIELNSDLYHQPEGICFDSSGQLYISNEKNEFFPSLLKLDLQK